MPAANQKVKQRNRDPRPKPMKRRCPTCGTGLINDDRCLGCSIEQAEAVRVLLRAIPRGEIISMLTNAREEGPTE
ncbi:MAG: hypothetical protein ACK506_16360 [Pirellula sp.]